VCTIVVEYDRIGTLQISVKGNKGVDGETKFCYILKIEAMVCLMTVFTKAIKHLRHCTSIMQEVII